MVTTFCDWDKFSRNSRKIWFESLNFFACFCLDVDDIADDDIGVEDGIGKSSMFLYFSPKFP